MEITCIVDGVAMSGGSLIMCACDTVEVNPSSLIMIHNAWSYFWGGYNARQLQELAAQLSAWDEMQATIYERKTGLPRAEIEAVSKGFADQLIDDAEPLQIAASADGRTLYIGARSFHLAPGMTAPAALEKIEAPENWRARMLAKLRKES